MMVRSDLIAALGRDYPDLSAAEIERVVSRFFEAISQRLINNERVELRGFGTFSTRARDGRIGRNPRTGDTVQVRPKRAVYFKPGKEMRGRLNEKR